jgi:hypothetical protein
MIIELLKNLLTTSCVLKIGRVCRRSQNGLADVPSGHNFRGASGDALSMTRLVLYPLDFLVAFSCQRWDT